MQRVARPMECGGKRGATPLSNLTTSLNYAGGGALRLPPHSLMTSRSSEAGLRLAMRRDNLENLPHHPVPAGFSLRWYEAGDDQNWLEIHRQADRLNRITPGLFAEQFGSDAQLLEQRQCYLLGQGNKCLGTATAWFNDDLENKTWGRVHWLAVLPQYQGKGLGKSLLSAVCGRLQELGHPRAYLTTSSWRLPAIGLYRRFGFTPWIRSAEEEVAWAAMAP